MSFEHVEQLAALINHLPFAEVVMSDNTADGTKIQVLCRVKKGAEQHWAEVMEKILRRAEISEFKAHVCRLYFLHNQNMVYGWHVGLTSDVMGRTVEMVDAVIGHKGKKPRAAIGKAAPVNGQPWTTDYSPPLQADEKGNPIVEQQVMSMPFTGMEGKRDRNFPSPPAEDGRGGGRGVTKIS